MLIKVNKALTEGNYDQFITYCTEDIKWECVGDIRLRELSKGRSGTQKLIQALVKKYGHERSFRDDVLFDTITEMTFSEIHQFFGIMWKMDVPCRVKKVCKRPGLNMMKISERFF